MPFFPSSPPQIVFPQLLLKLLFFVIILYIFTEIYKYPAESIWCCLYVYDFRDYHLVLDDD